MTCQMCGSDRKVVVVWGDAKVGLNIHAPDCRGIAYDTEIWGQAFWDHNPKPFIERLIETMLRNVR